MLAVSGLLLQVFLTIARKAEVEAAAQEGRSTETIHLPEGALLKVPLGEEYATVEGGTQQYQVKWAQDESIRQAESTSA